MRRAFRRASLGGWIAGLAVLAALPAVRALRVGAMDHYLATQRYEDIYYLPPSSWLPVFSLGHDRAMADLIWMRGLVYFGDEMVHRGEVAHVLEYADAIVTLDPDFKRVYEWATMAALYNPKTELPPADIERARAFLARGVERFPGDGDLAWEMGALLAYELAPRIDDPAERERLKAEASEYLMIAARQGAGPPWLALSNASELERLGRTEQAARHLEEMYALVDDPQTRAQLRRKIAALRSQAHAEALERATRELEARRREEYPYLPTDLYLLVGPRPVIEEGALIERGFLPEDPGGASPGEAP